MRRIRPWSFAFILVAPALTFAQPAVSTTHPDGGIPDRRWGLTFSYDCVPVPPKALEPPGCRPIELAMKGDPGTSWAVLAGNLPAGVVLRPDGKFEGFPTQTGEFNIIVQALNSITSGSSTRQFHFRVNPLRERCMPTLAAASAYSVCCFCSGPTKYSLSVLEGTLPGGMRYENLPGTVPGTTAGYITGTPDESGVFHHVGRCQAEGAEYISTWSLTITVDKRTGSAAVTPLSVSYCPTGDAPPGTAR